MLSARRVFAWLALVLALCLLSAVGVSASGPNSNVYARCGFGIGQTTTIPPGVNVRPVNFDWYANYVVGPGSPLVAYLNVVASTVDDTNHTRSYSDHSGYITPSYYATAAHMARGYVYVQECVYGNCGSWYEYARCDYSVPAPSP